MSAPFLRLYQCTATLGAMSLYAKGHARLLSGAVSGFRAAAAAPVARWWRGFSMLSCQQFLSPAQEHVVRINERHPEVHARTQRAQRVAHVVAQVAPLLRVHLCWA